MADYWLDILSSTGARYGAGPIDTCASWECTPRLDGAGTFSFTMPVSDPRADLVQVKRFVRCWTVDNGQQMSLGAGRIEQISTTITPESAPMLQVSGVTRLGALIDEHIDNLALMTEVEDHPAILLLQKQSDDSDLGSLANCYDYALRDETTHVHLDYTQLSATDAGKAYLYAAHVRAFHKVRFTITGGVPYVDMVVPGDVLLGAEYWNNESEAWDTLTITSDGTDLIDFAVYGNLYHHTFDQTGDVTFDIPAGWGVAALDSVYKVRFFVSAGHIMNSIELADVTVFYNAPTLTALADIMARAPAGWSLDAANGYTSTSSATELGSNLVVNGGFANYTGAVDDDATDAFASWLVTAAGGHKIEATATAHGGVVASKLTTDAGTAGTPILAQTIAVDPASDYLLSFWTRGDGTAQSAYRIQDLTYGGATWVALTNPVDTGVTGTDWVQITRTFTTPAACTSIYILFYGPVQAVAGSVYVDDVTLYRRLGGEVYGQLAGETVLEALGRVAEQTGEHFIESPASDQQVLWLRQDERPASVRAIGNADPIAVEDNADVALIKSLQEIKNGYDLISRVYPYGGGEGAARAMLADCTRTAPTGYTLDKTARCLIRDVTETNIGRFARRLDCPDINAQNTSQSQREFAANALFDRAYVYLLRHSATSTDRLTGDVPKAYKAELVKCDRILLPGQVIRVVYHEWAGGYHAISIDADLWILAATTRADNEGVRTVALEVANVAAQPVTTDAQLLYRMLQAQRAARSHGAAESGLNSALVGTVAGLDVRNGKIVRVRRT